MRQVSNRQIVGGLTVFSLIAISIYVFYFLFLPQSWALNDDYGQIKDWAMNPHLNPWQMGWDWFVGRMSEGRFLPLDSIFRLLRYKYLPTQPVYFRLGQFALLAMALWGYVRFIKNIGLNSLQVAFAIFLVLVNLSLKEWIVLTASAETLAVPFFFVSLAFYTSGKKWTGVLFLFCSFLSKESFFVLCGTIGVIEYFDWKKAGKVSWGPIVLLIFGTLTLVVELAHLHRVYTGGSHFSRMSLKNIFIGLITPPIKCFGAGILFSSFVFWLSDRKKILKENETPIVISLALIIPFSILLSLWGRYDSWGYLHLVLPWGWALLLAAPLSAWPQVKRPVFVMALLLFLVASSLIMTLRGGFNRWNFLAEAKIAADVACEDYQRTPTLKIFSNCEEGSNQLQNYLAMYNKFCPQPPKITYIPEGLPSGLTGPYEIIFARKFGNTDGAEFKNLATTQRIDLNIWSIYKNIP